MNCGVDTLLEVRDICMGGSWMPVEFNALQKFFDLNLRGLDEIFIAQPVDSKSRVLLPEGHHLVVLLKPNGQAIEAAGKRQAGIKVLEVA